MTSILSPFAGLTNVTFQLVTTCNLSCDYCFQDACNVSTSPHEDDRRVANPFDTAETLMNLVRSSKEDLIMVFSGGEPMLVPVDWYETFFYEMDRYLDGSDRKVEYSVQTNISILKPEILDLFKRHNVHFSVHYDGELDDPKLLSRKRKENIATLIENGLAVTVLVVGTVESLKALPASIEFFNGQGIRFYRINYVSSQGRGQKVSLIPPGLRAEAEFEAAFLASQLDFSTRDNVVMNKFLHYYNNVICGSPYSRVPRPQQCMAGVRSAYVAVDGLIYPCSFFPSETGPMAKAEDLPSGDMKGAAAAVTACERSNAYYDERCPSCEALPICGEYCPLSPVTDRNLMESFCGAQVTLRRMMDENREISELIAKRFIEHKRAYPGDLPRSCGTRTT
jgi:radical SAM protein with 4Fe4S-binding SPASM domain